MTILFFCIPFYFKTYEIHSEMIIRMYHNVLASIIISLHYYHTRLFKLKKDFDCSIFKR
jgi:hypothetical protein